jgi:hypothetical protein
MPLATFNVRLSGVIVKFEQEQITLSRLIEVGRVLVTNEEAADFLRMKQQSLRRWACYDCGPIQPVRVGGRLRWRVADLVRLANGEA